MSYGNLLKSLVGLLRNQPVLKEASLIGAMMFATFSAFWTALSFLLKSPVYNLGAQAAGLFGLVGVVGALAASIVGRVTDKRSPRFTLTIAIILSALSYICFWIFGYRMWGLISGVILLDLGIQSGQISNQARINTLDATARSRNNAVYMAFYFGGGALGSLLGTFFWGLFGWTGVCAVGIIFQIIAATVHILGIKRR
jgi:predicted MFS family arabinose efflux permease